MTAASMLSPAAATEDWAAVVDELNALMKLRTIPFAMKLFERRADMEAIERIRRPQSVHTLDRRLQFFDLPETELLTHDPKGNTIDRTLSVVAYVCWRITDRDAGG